MSKYEELIERLEKLTGPDRNLGREILLACGWRKTQVGQFYGPLFYWSSSDGAIRFDDDKFADHDPTSSIDTALTLVPKGKYWEVAFGLPAQTIKHRYWAEVYSEEDAHESLHPMCAGATPAIALCIAALRARAEQEKK